MADPNIDIDEQIQELMYIRLGLENKSEKIFKDLLSSGKDPLDDIYRKMTNLKRQVAILTEENNMLKKERGSLSKDLKKEENARSWSLPPTHREDKQMIEQKKQDAQNLRKDYEKKSEQFSIFLIKCIREVSKSTFKS